MKRAIVNFSNDFNYDDFKEYSEKKKVSLSKALLELAQKSLDRWKDEQVADLAIARENDDAKSDYLDSDTFWQELDV